MNNILKFVVRQKQKNILLILFLVGLVFYFYFNYSIILRYVEYFYNYYFSYHNITLDRSPSKNVLLFSNSTMGEGKHFMYALPILKKFLQPFNITELLLVPYAYPDVRDGVDTHSISKLLPEAKETFKKINIDIILLDTTLPSKKQQELITNAQAIYFTGGNTFNLIKNIYDNDVLSIVKEKINQGIPVIGVSAGTVMHGPTIKTTNDMPVVYPSSFESLNTVPFQINAHYNNIVTPGFHGETRDMRLKEFLQYNRTLHNNSSLPNFVIGLMEGTAIHISGNSGELVGFGTRPAAHLQLDSKDNLVKKEISIGTRIDNLINL
jgi:dipeptidase E